MSLDRPASGQRLAGLAQNKVNVTTPAKKGNQQEVATNSLPVDRFALNEFSAPDACNGQQQQEEKEHQQQQNVARRKKSKRKSDQRQMEVRKCNLCSSTTHLDAAALLDSNADGKQHYCINVTDCDNQDQFEFRLISWLSDWPSDSDCASCSSALDNWCSFNGFARIASGFAGAESLRLSTSPPEATTTTTTTEESPIRALAERPTSEGSSGAAAEQLDWLAESTSCCSFTCRSSSRNAKRTVETTYELIKVHLNLRPSQKANIVAGELSWQFRQIISEPIREEAKFREFSIRVSEEEDEAASNRSESQPMAKTVLDVSLKRISSVDVKVRQGNDRKCPSGCSLSLLAGIVAISHLRRPPRNTNNTKRMDRKEAAGGGQVSRTSGRCNCCQSPRAASSNGSSPRPTTSSGSFRCQWSNRASCQWWTSQSGDSSSSSASVSTRSEQEEEEEPSGGLGGELCSTWSSCSASSSLSGSTCSGSWSLISYSGSSCSQSSLDSQLNSCRHAIKLGPRKRSTKRKCWSRSWSQRRKYNRSDPTTESKQQPRLAQDEHKDGCDNGSQQAATCSANLPEPKGSILVASNWSTLEEHTNSGEGGEKVVIENGDQVNESENEQRLERNWRLRSRQRARRRLIERDEATQTSFASSHSNHHLSNDGREHHPASAASILAAADQSQQTSAKLLLRCPNCQIQFPGSAVAPQEGADKWLEKSNIIKSQAEQDVRSEQRRQFGVTSDRWQADCVDKLGLEPTNSAPAANGRSRSLAGGHRQTSDASKADNNPAIKSSAILLNPLDFVWRGAETRALSFTEASLSGGRSQSSLAAQLAASTRSKSLCSQSKLQIDRLNQHNRTRVEPGKLGGHFHLQVKLPKKIAVRVGKLTRQAINQLRRLSASNPNITDESQIDPSSPFEPLNDIGWARAEQIRRKTALDYDDIIVPHQLNRFTSASSSFIHRLMPESGPNKTNSPAGPQQASGSRRYTASLANHELYYAPGGVYVGPGGVCSRNELINNQASKNSSSSKAQAGNRGAISWLPKPFRLGSSAAGKINAQSHQEPHLESPSKLCPPPIIIQDGSQEADEATANIETPQVDSSSSSSSSAGRESGQSEQIGKQANQDDESSKQQTQNADSRLADSSNRRRQRYKIQDSNSKESHFTAHNFNDNSNNHSRSFRHYIGQKSKPLNRAFSHEARLSNNDTCWTSIEHQTRLDTRTATLAVNSSFEHPQNSRSSKMNNTKQPQSSRAKDPLTGCDSAKSERKLLHLGKDNRMNSLSDLHARSEPVELSRSNIELSCNYIAEQTSLYLAELKSRYSDTPLEMRKPRESEHWFKLSARQSNQLSPAEPEANSSAGGGQSSNQAEAELYGANLASICVHCQLIAELTNHPKSAYLSQLLMAQTSPAVDEQSSGQQTGNFEQVSINLSKAEDLDEVVEQLLVRPSLVLTVCSNQSTMDAGDEHEELHDEQSVELKSSAEEDKKSSTRRQLCRTSSSASLISKSSREVSDQTSDLNEPVSSSSRSTVTSSSDSLQSSCSSSLSSSATSDRTESSASSPDHSPGTIRAASSKIDLSKTHSKSSKSPEPLEYIALLSDANEPGRGSRSSDREGQRRVTHRHKGRRRRSGAGKRVKPSRRKSKTTTKTGPKMKRKSSDQEKQQQQQLEMTQVDQVQTEERQIFGSTLEVPANKQARSASLDAPYLLKVPERQDFEDNDSYPSKSNRSRSVDISLPTKPGECYVVRQTTDGGSTTGLPSAEMQNKMGGVDENYLIRSLDEQK